jgi:hypothetical protein
MAKIMSVVRGSLEAQHVVREAMPDLYAFLDI